MNYSFNFKYCFVFIFLLFEKGIASAQNLFANPGFETINNCTEFKANCSPEAWFNIPAGNFLVKGSIASNPLLGNMVLIVPAGNVMHNFNKPRYVFTMLCCPLLKDKMYKLSFYVNTTSLENEKLFNVFFTSKQPVLSNADALTDTPAITVTKLATTEVPRSKWLFFEHTFTATGNEKFFIISTKGLPAVDYEMKQAMNKSGDILYFIDEIVLQSTESIPLCSEYEANSAKLFAYNYRHTDNNAVFDEIEKPKPVVKFVNDTVVIPGLLFDVNKSNIKPPVAKILDSLAVVLQQRNFIQVTISGHTDSTGNENNNLLLSEARAASVQQYLIEKMPAAAPKISAAGKASAMPIADNKTAAGRQLNRRVEIIITYWNKQ